MPFVPTGQKVDRKQLQELLIQRSQENAAKAQQAAAEAAQNATLLGTLTRGAKKVVQATGFEKAADTFGSLRARQIASPEAQQYIPKPTTGEVAGAVLQTASLLAPVGTAARALGTVAGKTAGNILAGAGTGYAMDVGTKLAEGKTGMEAFTPGIGTAVGAAIPGAAPMAKALGRGTKAVTKYGTSQITGLKPETVSKIISNGDELKSAMESGLDRAHFAQEVEKAFQSFTKQFSATGKKYDPIRKSGQIVNVDKDVFGEVLRKFGIGIKDGQIVRTSESVPLKPGDVNALNDVMSIFGGKTKLNANEFLNLRGALSDLAKFDATKSDVSNAIAKEMRKAFDAFGKRDIKGLAELDASFAPMKKLNQALRARLFTKEGTLKDTAISSLANITGKGKEKLLERVEEIAPGVGQRAQILKAIEDIADSEGHKVGTYVRAGLSGGAALTGNIPMAIATFILGTPKVAVPILRQFGKAVKIKNSIIESLTNKLKNGGLLNQSEQKLMRLMVEDKVKGAEKGFKAPGDYLLEKMKGKGGLSIQDVSKGKAGYSDPLLQEARKYKSAEEFVKAQGKSIYHGGNEKITEFTDKGRGGVFLTPDKKMAQTHADFQKFTGGKSEITEAVVKPENVYKIKKGTNSFTGLDNDALIEQPELYTSEINAIKAKGFDAIQSSDGRQLFVFDPSKIKTKSQLTDLWKKARGETKRGFGTGAGRPKSNVVEDAREKVSNVMKNFKPNTPDEYGVQSEIEAVKRVLARKKVTKAEASEAVAKLENAVTKALKERGSEYKKLINRDRIKEVAKTVDFETLQKRFPKINKETLKDLFLEAYKELRR